MKDLPPPPSDKSGWPWTAESCIQLAGNGIDWPVITVVTPSFNQGDFLEATIRSVLLQGYPNLEYIIMDGGSTDESVAIIQKYANWVSHWVSDDDDGQYDAINKGFAQSTGNIMAWINSDDMYAPNCFKTVGDIFDILGDRVKWITGVAANWDSFDRMCSVSGKCCY